MPHFSLLLSEPPRLLPLLFMKCFQVFQSLALFTHEIVEKTLLLEFATTVFYFSIWKLYQFGLFISYIEIAILENFTYVIYMNISPFSLVNSFSESLYVCYTYICIYLVLANTNLINKTFSWQHLYQWWQTYNTCATVGTQNPLCNDIKRCMSCFF